MRWIKQHSRRNPHTGELVTVKSHFAKDIEQNPAPLCTRCYYRHQFGTACDWSKPLRERPPQQLELI